MERSLSESQNGAKERVVVVYSSSVDINIVIDHLMTLMYCKPNLSYHRLHVLFSF